MILNSLSARAFHLLLMLITLSACTSVRVYRHRSLYSFLFPQHLLALGSAFFCLVSCDCEIALYACGRVNIDVLMTNHPSFSPVVCSDMPPFAGMFEKSSHVDLDVILVLASATVGTFFRGCHGQPDSVLALL